MRKKNFYKINKGKNKKGKKELFTNVDNKCRKKLTCVEKKFMI